jgi:hypothetical protein
MRREPKAYLWDAREAIDAIAVFTRGRTAANSPPEKLELAGILWF